MPEYSGLSTQASFSFLTTMMSIFDRFAPLLAVVFAVLLWLQCRQPLRVQRFSAWGRVLINLTFALPAFVVLRLALIPLPLAAAWWGKNAGIGVLQWLPLPVPAAVLGGVVVMDYAYYWWHIATHRVSWLWRFHNVHHTDLDMDVSTATRFHFGELVLSVGFRVAAVVVFGIAPVALIVFELIFETAGQFHHSNWRLPMFLERLLSQVVVTPRLHGIHHSIVRDETDSNWGTIFSFWDRLHHTARRDVPQHAITIGVPAYRAERELTFRNLWAMPFGPQRSWQLPDGTTPARAPEDISHKVL